MKILPLSSATLLSLGVFLFAGCTATPNGAGGISSSSSSTPLGGDRDEHGCIPSAGYQWCEAKQKCIRPWEETCETSTRSSSSSVMPLGGDRDEHGCIGSAGYSWCEPKNKCLRIWEEACYESLKQEIQYLLANKYGRPVAEVRVTVSKQMDNYAAGGVKFGTDDHGPGGLFLAAKIDNVWQIVYDGNGSIDCARLRQEYGFPEDILKPNFCDS